MRYIKPFLWLSIPNKEVLIPSTHLCGGSRFTVCYSEKDFIVVPRMEWNNWFAILPRTQTGGLAAPVPCLCQPWSSPVSSTVNESYCHLWTRRSFWPLTVLHSQCLVPSIQKAVWVRCSPKVRYSRMKNDFSATMSLLNFHHRIPDLTSDLASQAGEGLMDESVHCAWPLGRKLIRMLADMIYGTVSSLCLISFQPFTPSDSHRASRFPMATVSLSLADC